MIIDLMNNLKKIVKDKIIPKRNNLRIYLQKWKILKTKMKIL